ncbi:MAG TPA: YihY/virulence factor BrkB family protein [Gemmatimonadales bacterium]|nr:YihY/virulence factor BrkB family protein [Gemmatimonadales bacterium]
MNLQRLRNIRLPTFPRLMVAAVQSWSSDEVPRLGASLAYYTLFALSPILVIAIAIAGSVYGEQAVRGQVVNEISGLIGRQGAEAVQALLQGAHQDRTGSFAVIVGTVTLLIAASGAFLELQHALNKIFRVKTDPQKSGIQRLILSRLRSFGVVVSIGFLLLVSLLVSAALTAISERVQTTDVLGPFLLQAFNLVVSLAVMTLLFGLIYRLLPDVRLAWRDVWTGAFVTSVFFSVGKFLIGLYLGHSSVASSYGAAGSVVVLLVWVYYSAQVILLGAEFTRVYAEHRRGAAPPPNHLARRDPDAHPSAARETS